MKEVTITTGPHGGLGNVAIQTDAIKRLLDANETTIRNQDAGLRDFMKDDYVGHEQKVFRIAQVPATSQTAAEAMAGDNLHITTFDRKYEGNKPVTLVKNGAKPEELDQLVKSGYLRQHDIKIQYSVHGAGGERKLVEHPVSLFQESYGGGRVKAAVDHLAGAADLSIWERLTKAIEENGGKVLKKIIRV
ncbi:MAG: hypothetical protein JWM80_2375 [Cyanobacteria bacterium RYN_339]|nr:hypothetical protein [Cyanobacteria bacterium RYN_339]